MGISFFGSILVFSIFFSPFSCQPPNTDEFFLSEFFNQVGFTFSKSQMGSICALEGVVCDNDKHVIELIASGLGLSGSIPDTTIGKLSKLQSLDLNNNKITALPSDFWSLGSLKNLNLSFNQISGNLPNNIGNFGLLETIDISSNNFSGEIPTAMTSLVNLQVVKMDQNRFEGSVSSDILRCKSLVSIDLSSNQLTGNLPIGFRTLSPNLRSLNLAMNQFSGRDLDFAGMEFMTSLNISRNLFSGSVMGVFQPVMETIDLSHNQFEGHISQVQFNSSFHLVYLDLSDNKLSGEIFQNLNHTENLKYLNLAHNRFSRQAFPKLEMLSSLEYLNLSKTGLIGIIPSEISTLKNLRKLDLSSNQLTGSIPTFSIRNLEVLDASTNNLTGKIPISLLQKLPLMERFNFSYNNLTFCASEFSNENETIHSAFIGSTSTCPIAANPALFKRKTTKHKGLKLIIGLSISMVCLLVGLALLVSGCRKKSKLWTVKQPSYKEEQTISGPFSFQTDSTTWVADVKQANSVPVIIFEKPLLNITFADLLSATSNFNRGTLLAEGKFGPVYRGFLSGGIHVAVKVLVNGSTLTDQEAARELEYLGRVKHPNLVPLTGYCLAGDQRIAIYDYMENGNLQNLLYDLPLGIQRVEDWSTDTWENQEDIQNVGSEQLLTTWRFRHKIALGFARAMAFLHHGCSPPIIHRDIKASSLYLDYNLEPRLSDFGLAKIFGSGLDEETGGGSTGYLPPEQECSTTKSDVYCFGVVLFELMTGKKPIGDEYCGDGNLVSWVRGLVRKNEGSRAVDPKIRETGSNEQMEEAIKIGYLCTADLPSKRPSMHQIVGLLKDIEPSTQL